MIKEDKLVTLIKQYCREADEEDLAYELMDENLSHVFDVTVEGLASYFNDIAEDHLAEYFAETFGLYSPNRLYRDPKGYYFLYLDLKHEPSPLY